MSEWMGPWKCKECGRIDLTGSRVTAPDGKGGFYHKHGITWGGCYGEYVPYDRRTAPASDAGLREALKRVSDLIASRNYVLAESEALAPLAPREPAAPVGMEECAACHGSGWYPKGTSANAIDRLKNFLAEPEEPAPTPPAQPSVPQITFMGAGQFRPEQKEEK